MDKKNLTSIKINIFLNWQIIREVDLLYAKQKKQHFLDIEKLSFFSFLWSNPHHSDVFDL